MNYERDAEEQIRFTKRDTKEQIQIMKEIRKKNYEL